MDEGSADGATTRKKYDEKRPQQQHKYKHWVCLWPEKLYRAAAMNTHRPHDGRWRHGRWYSEEFILRLPHPVFAFFSSSLSLPLQVNVIIQREIRIDHLWSRQPKEAADRETTLAEGHWICMAFIYGCNGRTEFCGLSVVRWANEATATPFEMRQTTMRRAGQTSMEQLAFLGISSLFFSVLYSGGIISGNRLWVIINIFVQSYMFSNKRHSRTGHPVRRSSLTWRHLRIIDRV